MQLHPELEKAIEINQAWIRKRCAFNELNPSKIDDLISDVYFNLIDSNKYFIKQESVNATAWVKKVTTNTVAEYTRKEMRFREHVETGEKHDEFIQSVEDEQMSDGVPLEVQELFDFIERNFKDKDREIIKLHMMQESNAAIAEIMGLEVVTIANKLSLLRKELNEFIQRGENDE